MKIEALKDLTAMAEKLRSELGDAENNIPDLSEIEDAIETISNSILEVDTLTSALIEIDDALKEIEGFIEAQSETLDTLNSALALVVYAVVASDGEQRRTMVYDDEYKAAEAASGISYAHDGAVGVWRCEVRNAQDIYLLTCGTAGGELVDSYVEGTKV